MHLVSVLLVKMQVPDDGEMDIEEFEQFRREFVTVFTNLFNVKNLKEVIGSQILDKLGSLTNLKQNEIDNVLFLIINMNLTLNNPVDQQFSEAILMNILKIDLVSLCEGEKVELVFEIMIKTIGFYIKNAQYVKLVVDCFLGNKGIFNNDYKSGSKIAAFLTKLIEKGKLEIDFVAEDILLNIVHLFNSLISSLRYDLIAEYSSLYSSYSLIVLQKYVSYEKRRTYWFYIKK